MYGSSGGEENPFVPALIDIICPFHKSKPIIHQDPITTTTNLDLTKYDLSQVCFVMEYVDSDLDHLLKNQINFS